MVFPVFAHTLDLNYSLKKNTVENYVLSEIVGKYRLNTRKLDTRKSYKLDIREGVMS